MHAVIRRGGVAFFCVSIVLLADASLPAQQSVSLPTGWQQMAPTDWRRPCVR